MLQVVYCKGGFLFLFFAAFIDAGDEKINCTISKFVDDPEIARWVNVLNDTRLMKGTR